MQKLNKELNKYEYLTGNKLSVVDFVVFCEIQQVLKMYGRHLPHHLSKLHEWYEKIEALPALAEITPKLDEVIAQYGLTETKPAEQ